MATAVRARRVLGVSLPVLFLAGCISTTFRPNEQVKTHQSSPVALERVQVLHSFPDTPFLSLGEIEAYMSGYHKDADVIMKARQKAAAIGADAIVYDSEGLVTSAKADTLTNNDRTQRASARFVAIRLLSQDAPTHTPGAT